MQIGIIGAGAAGYFAAIRAADCNPNANIKLLEGTRRPLTKVKISGGGRCNVTHACFDVAKLVQNYPRGYRELRGPFSYFQPRDTIKWFEERGVQLKTEADGRMFPLSDNSQTIIDTLVDSAKKAKVEIILGEIVRRIKKADDSKFAIECGQNIYIFDRILLATGGMQAGFELARELGHTIVTPKPSLFTFCIEHPLLKDLAGQSFVEVACHLSCEKNKFHALGPVLITHWGLSGPAILKLSAFAARDLYDSNYQADLVLDFAPHLQAEHLLEKIKKMRVSHADKLLIAAPPAAISKRFWQRFLEIFGIDIKICWRNLSNQSCIDISRALKNIALEVKGKGEFKSEFVTSGGIELKEVDFKTMQSKVCPGLFFAGEILDIDGVTGGFNFQNAWTTGWIAGENIGR